MFLTVRDALNIGPMKRARLIAGHGGLDNQVKSVTIMDTPDIKNWLRGGELLLSNVFVIKDDPMAQIRLVEDLATCGAAALGIKLQRYVESLPEQMLTLADRCDLPLIEMPVDCAWIDVMNPLLTEIMNRHLAALERSEEIHRTFTRIALKGGGLWQIASNLATLVQNPVVITNSLWKIMVRADPMDTRLPGSEKTPAQEPDLAALVARLAEGPEIWPCPSGEDGAALTLVEEDLRAEQGDPGGSFRVLVASVRSERELYGYVVIPETRGPLTPADRIAIEHAVTVTALEMAKARAIEEVEKRYRQQFVYDLITGNIASREAALSRARALGWDLNNPRGVMVAQIDHPRDCQAGKRAESARKSPELPPQFIRAVQNAATAACPEAVVVDLIDNVIILFPGEDHEVASRSSAPRETATAIIEKVKAEAPHVNVSVGVSRVYRDVLDVKQAYAEARRALALGKRIWGENQAVHYDDLGPFRVLDADGNRDELASFYRDTLKAVLEYDRIHDTDLIRTLETYFRCSEDVCTTARELYVHPNTVRYRLERIQEIVGLSVTSSEDKFNLQLALKIMRLIQEETRLGEM